MLDKLNWDSLQLEGLALELGKTKEEAYKLSLKKLDLFQDNATYKKALRGMNKITLRKMVPISLLEGFSNQDVSKQQQRLWEVGVDAINHHWFLDVLCSTLGDKRICDMFAIGQERTDEEWVNLTVNGVRVASLEAQLFFAKDVSLNRELLKLSMR